MDLQSIGKIVLVVGVVIAVLGGLLMLAAQIPFLNNLGDLPGSIRVEGQGFSCFVPVVGMILLSILLTVVLNIIVRLINRP